MFSRIKSLALPAVVLVVLGSLLGAFVVRRFRTDSSASPGKAIPTPGGAIAEDAAVDREIGRSATRVATTGAELTAHAELKTEIESATPPARTPSVTEDPTWAAIARNQMAFEDLVVIGPLAAHALFRNTQCNPRDLVILPARRHLLEDYCSKMQAELEALTRLTSATAFGDMEKLIEGGQSRRRRFADIEARLTSEEQRVVATESERLLAPLAAAMGKSLEQMKTDPTTAVVVPHVHFNDGQPLVWGAKDGVLHSAMPKDLPNANKVLAARRWACFEIGSVACSFFMDNGCLEVGEVDTLMQRLVAKIERDLGS